MQAAPELPHLRAISLDYDGFYSQGFSRCESKESFVATRKFFNWLEEENKKDLAERHVFYNGSLRQDSHLDVFNSERNDNEYCFNSLPILIKNFIVHTGIPAVLDPLSTADLRHKKISGHCFSEARKLYASFPPPLLELDNAFLFTTQSALLERAKKRQEELMAIVKSQLQAYPEKTKILMLLAQLHKVAKHYSKHRITFIFGDDQDPILDEIKDFFAVYPLLLPPNVHKLLLVSWQETQSQKPLIRHTITSISASAIDECFAINYLRLSLLFINEKGKCNFSNWRTMRIGTGESSNDPLAIEYFLKTRETKLNAELLAMHPATSEGYHIVIDEQCLQLNAMLRLLQQFVFTIQEFAPEQASSSLVANIEALKTLNVVKHAEYVRSLFIEAKNYLRNYTAGTLSKLLSTFGFYSPPPTPVVITTLLQKFDELAQGNIYHYCDPRLVVKQSSSIIVALPAYSTHAMGNS